MGLEAGGAMRKSNKIMAGIVLLLFVLFLSSESAYAEQPETDSVDLMAVPKLSEEIATVSGNVPKAGIDNAVVLACEAMNLAAEVRVEDTGKEEIVITGVVDGAIALAEEIKIPEGVTGIEGGFRSSTSIKRVEIPSTVRYIGNEIFSYSALEDVIVKEGDGSLILGNKVFYGCNQLRNAYLPDRLVEWGDSTFVGVKEMETFIIPKDITSIPPQTFMDCTKLREIMIPETVTEIGVFAFYNCDSLTSATIPSKVIKIGQSIFEECDSLESAVIECDFDAVEAYGREYFPSMFSGCDSLRYVTFSQPFTNLPSHIFYRCKSLEEITIPEGVKTIGTGAFMESGIKRVIIPEGVTHITSSAFENCYQLEQVTLPDSIEIINNNAFRNSYPHKRLDLSDCSLKTIGIQAFMGTGIEEAILPDSVDYIGNNAFAGCKNMKKINIPKGLKRLLSGAFCFIGVTDDSVLENTELILSKDIEHIGGNAFWGWDNLKNIDFSKANNLEEIGGYLFTNESMPIDLDSLKIPVCLLNGRVDIQDAAFSGLSCANLTIGMEMETPDSAAMKEYRDIICNSGISKLKSMGVNTDRLVSLEGSLNGENFDIIALQYQHLIANEYFNQYVSLDNDSFWEKSFLDGEAKSYTLSYGSTPIGSYACDNFYDLCLDLVQSGNIALLDSEVKPKVDELCGRLYDSVADLSSELPKGISDISITDTRGEKKGGE